MTTNIASSDAAMDICSSPNGVSVDARPPTASFCAAANSEGHGAVEAGRRSGAATRLDYGGVQATTGDGGTRSSSVEGAVATVKDKQVTSGGFKPQEGTKEVNKEAGGVVAEGAIDVDTSEWTLDDWLKDDSAIHNATLTHLPSFGETVRCKLSTRDRFQRALASYCIVRLRERSGILAQSH